MLRPLPGERIALYTAARPRDAGSASAVNLICQAEAGGERPVERTGRRTPGARNSMVNALPTSVSAVVSAGVGPVGSGPTTLEVQAVQWSGVFSSQARS